MLTVRVTRKQLGGYYKARRNGITVNDAYNMAEYGITEREYSVIRKIEQEKFGLDHGHLSLNDINGDKKD
jgi:hypothetical protein